MSSSLSLSSATSSSSEDYYNPPIIKKPAAQLPGAFTCMRSRTGRLYRVLKEDEPILGGDKTKLEHHDSSGLYLCSRVHRSWNSYKEDIEQSICNILRSRFSKRKFFRPISKKSYLEIDIIVSPKESIKIHFQWLGKSDYREEKKEDHPIDPSSTFAIFQKGLRYIDESRKARTRPLALVPFTKVGSGSFGAVFYVNDSGQQLAVKICKIEDGYDLTDFFKEAFFHLLLNLNRTPNVPKLFTNYRIDGLELDHKFFVFEYAGPFNLAKTISGNPEISLPYVKKILEQLAASLENIHELDPLKLLRESCPHMMVSKSGKPGILHADLKPENIACYQDFTIRLLDFGISQLLGNLEDFPHPPINTFHVRSLEVTLGFEKLDSRVDSWSLGCLLFKIFFKKDLFLTPFNDKQPLEDSINADHSFLLMLRILGLPPVDVLNQIMTNPIITSSGTFIFLHKGHNFASDTVIEDLCATIAKEVLKKGDPRKDTNLMLFLDLERRLLDVNPYTRIFVKDIKKHPFMTYSPSSKFSFEDFLSREEITSTIEFWQRLTQTFPKRLRIPSNFIIKTGGPIMLIEEPARKR